MDENYQTYLNRVMRLTLPETYGSQVHHIQESPKFEWHPDQGWQASSFPGYTVITPPGPEDEKNATLYQNLKSYQSYVARRLDSEIGSEMFVPIPAESFHVTLADLIWDSAYRHACETPGFEERLRDRAANSFRQCQPLSLNQPIRFQVLGLMVMTRAIGVCLATSEQESYERILKLRRSLYQNPDLIEIGIEQQYYFTPHITLGYFGKFPENFNRERLIDLFDELNQQWLEGYPNEFWVHRAELRKFDNMSAYYRSPDWVTFQF